LAFDEKLGLNIAPNRISGQVAKVEKIFYTASGFASAKTIFCHKHR